MDKIYRKISLEPLKNRTPNNLPYYYVTNGKCVLNDIDTEHHPWGGYCVDLLIPKVGNKDNYSKGIKWAMELWENFNLENKEVKDNETDEIIVAYWGRYKNLMMIYHWLINEYIPSINFYVKCGKKFKKVKITNKRTTFENCADIYRDISDISNDIEIGSIVGTSQLYDEFVKQFKNKDYAIDFMLFIHRIEHEGLFGRITGTTPYMNVDFSIMSEQTDMGIMSPLWRKWEPKRKYYLGEVVEYDNKPYMLIKTGGDYDKYELSGDLLESVLKSIKNGDIAVNGDKNTPMYKIVYSAENEGFELSFVNKGNGVLSPVYTRLVLKTSVQLEQINDSFDRYFFILPYYTGHYDENTMTSSFDDINNQHWVELGTKQETTKFEYTGITESELYTLKRNVTSVDDYGETLPFIYDMNGGIPVSGTTQLFYRGGPVNERNYREKDTVCNADWLYSVKYKENEDDKWANINLSEKDIDVDGKEIDGSEGIIRSSAFACDSGICEFTYYVGCDVNIAHYKNENVTGITKTRVENTGVKFTETWGFERKHLNEVHINQIEYDFEYIYLYPINNDEYSDGNVDINEKMPIYSMVTYYDGQLCKDYASAPFYKDENLIGIQDINTLEYDMHQDMYASTINAYIERGVSSSFERHNILGEIKTFADLENYRNDYFNIANS